MGRPFGEANWFNRQGGTKGRGGEEEQGEEEEGRKKEEGRAAITPTTSHSGSGKINENY